MNKFKRILAVLLSALMIISLCVPEVFAEEYDDTVTETEEIPNAIPELILKSSKKYEMWAGTTAIIPMEFDWEKNKNFFYAEAVVTGGVKDVYTGEDKIRFYNDHLSFGFSVTAGKTAEVATHTFTATVKLYDSNEVVLSTQTFSVDVSIKNKLDIKGVTIDSYKISKTPVKPGDAFTIDVTLKNNSGIDVKRAELSLEGLDTAKFVLDKGFSKQYVDIRDKETGIVSFSLIAQKGITLVRENLTLSLTYTLDEKKDNYTNKVTTQLILVCQPDASAVEYGAHDLTITNYTVSNNEVESGTKFDLVVDVKNNGNEDIKTARITLGADGTKFSVESGLAYRDFSIKKGAVQRFTFKLIGAGGIANVREYIPIVVEFGTKSVTEQVTVNCKPAVSSTAGKYDITMTDYTVDMESVVENAVFGVTFDLRNNSKVPIKDARVSMMNLDGTKFALDSGLSYRDFDIEAGETKTFSFRLVGCKGIASIRETIPVQIDYGAISSTAYITVKCVPKESNGTDESGKKVFAPNIIIESYEYGGSFVTAGKQFPLTIVIKNMSSQAVVENLKVTINGKADQEGKIAYSPANSSNSFFFDSLGLKQVETICMDLLPKSDASPNSYPVEISFSYEYAVNNERYKADGVTETITIPLRQEDRLVINEPELPGWTVSVGEMCNLSMSLVNKGKSAVYNVTATVEGDGFSVETPTYYIGNINSGVEEYYDAKITPNMEGDVTGTILFTYEDSNGDAKENRVPFTFQAASINPDFGMYDDMGMDMGMEPPAEESGFPVIWVIVGAAVLLVAVIIIIVVVVKKKKKKAELEDDDEDI